MKERVVSLCTNLVALALLSVCAYAAGPKLQTLHSFTGGSDGEGPVSTLAVDRVGNLYGTTGGGGGATACELGCGTVFMLAVPATQNGAWKETVLYSFTGGSDGAGPAAGLIFDRAGNLYGTTAVGGDGPCNEGVGGCGVVFELSPPAAPGGAWTEAVLHSFSGSDGSGPIARLTLDQAGNLYGTTNGGGSGSGCSAGCGVVFELVAPASQGGAWTYSVLHNFSQDGSDGFLPYGDLVLDPAGNLYGTTIAGGTGNAGGTVFELEALTWAENILYTFPSGHSGPAAGVIFDQVGNLYGTTEGGGASGQGSVFKLTRSGSAWTETVLFDGRAHAATFLGDLIFDQSGKNLYGTAEGFGGGAGALFRLQNGANWKEAEIDLFIGTGPGFPRGGLVFGKLGALYGTSSAGGTSQNCRFGCGTVFGILP